IIIGTLVAIGLLVLLFYFDLEQYVVAIFYWLDTIGDWSIPALMSIIMTLVVFILPSILFTLGAGYLFGVFLGCVCVVVGTTVGATIAFFIARYLFGESVANYLRQNKKLKFITDEFVHEGWKVIILIRLIPFFPLKLTNYFFGVTNFKALHFILGTFFGIIPNSVFVVYLGSLALDIHMLMSGDIIRTPKMWVFNILGVIVLIVAIRYINIHAQRALSRYQVQSSESGK
ncbi:VTT domain-containing protein, partial [Aliiglaciecola sp.]|nr:VTT domain-containing protein [Aliiglaciecola sp.]